MAPLGECLHSTYEALGWIPSTNETEQIPSTWEVEGETRGSRSLLATQQVQGQSVLREILFFSQPFSQPVSQIDQLPYPLGLGQLS